jgi:hypothetical protein
MELVKGTLYSFAFIFIMIFFYGSDDTTSRSSATIDKQAQCMGDPTTHFNASLFQQKHPNLSKSQIVGILCTQ